MKALTLWQPWASAISAGLKTHETRSWPAVSDGSAYAGWLVITAAKKKEDTGRLRWIKHKLDLKPDAGPEGVTEKDLMAAIRDYNALPFGQAVAVVYLKACHPTDGLVVSDLERSWGNYGPDRFAWEFSEIWRIDQPFAVKGEQKLFNVDIGPTWQLSCTRIFLKPPQKVLKQ